MGHHNLLRITAFLGAITVALGAYSAHGLKSKLPPSSVEIFQTGVQYQFYHVIVLLFTCNMYGKYNNNKLYAAILLFFAGIILFSGSLYVLAFSIVSKNHSFDWLGPVTPIGGLAFMAGWILLGLGIGNSRGKKYRRSES